MYRRWVIRTNVMFQPQTQSWKWSLWTKNAAFFQNVGFEEGKKKNQIEIAACSGTIWWSPWQASHPFCNVLLAWGQKLGWAILPSAHPWNPMPWYSVKCSYACVWSYTLCLDLLRRRRNRTTTWLLIQVIAVSVLRTAETSSKQISIPGLQRERVWNASSKQLNKTKGYKYSLWQFIIAIST